MSVTLVEFLDPVKGQSQTNLSLAALYYLKHHGDQPEATAKQVREALERARIRGANTLNVSRALGKAGAKVDREGSSWVLTGTGDREVRELLALPDETPQVQHDVAGLERLAAEVDDEATRGFISEAVKCLKVTAYRAAIVFLWTGAVAALRDQIWDATNKPKDIEEALQKHRGNAKFGKKGDFAYVKDSELIQLAFDLSLIDKTQKEILGQDLDLRNGCGHPTKYDPGEKKASGFIEDVIGIIFA